MEERRPGVTENKLIAEIDRRLKQLSNLNTFVMFLLVSIVTILAYEPFRGTLDFLPDVSLTSIIIMAVILSLSASYMFRILTYRVVSGIRDYDRQLQGILDISRSTRDEEKGEVLLEKIMEYAFSLTGSEAGAILMIEGEELVFKHVKGEALAGIVGMSVPLGQGISGWVVEHGFPFYIEDMSVADGFDSTTEWISDYKVHSALCVPLTSRRGVIGVIEMMNKKGGVYEEKDMLVASFLAEQVSAAIERSAFYENHADFEKRIGEILVDAIDHVAGTGSDHSSTVSGYTDIIARSMKMTPDERHRLKLASMYHDIGYLGLSMGYGSPGAAREKHSSEGFEILNDIAFYRDIAPAVRHHHERFDGKGFPLGLSGADIPVEARIIAIAEVFDEIMRSNRIKESSDGFRQAIGEIRERSGTEFDPYLVDIFIRNMELELNSQKKVGA